MTALADVRTADGSEQKLIVRSDPPGGEGVFQSERDREWELLQALWNVDSVEIPRPRWYDGSGELLGSKTIIMDHVTGTPLQLTLGPDADLAAARRIFLEVADGLRRTPLEAMPTAMDRPTDWDSYIDSAIDLYADAERELTDSSPIIRYVTAWLRANKPPPVPLAVVHGDFNPGNILVSDEHPPVVIDWEFTRIGDPREDIGYYSGSPLPNSMYTADPEAFLAEYRELTGFTRGAGQPGGDGVLLRPRDGRAVRPDDAGRRRPVPRAGQGDHDDVPHQQPVLLPGPVPRHLLQVSGKQEDE